MKRYSKNNKILCVIISLMTLVFMLSGCSKKEPCEVKITDSYSNDFALFVKGVAINRTDKNMRLVGIKLPTYDDNGNKVANETVTIIDLEPNEVCEFEIISMGATTFDIDDSRVEVFN